MQIINVSLAKATSTKNIIKTFPNKQQNSLTLLWHSSQNRIPWHSLIFQKVRTLNFLNI